MIIIHPHPAEIYPFTEPIRTKEFISRRNRAYSEIYEQICCCNEQGVSCLLLAYQDVLSVGNAFDLMQTCLCTLAAKLAADDAQQAALRAAAGIHYGAETKAQKSGSA